MRGGWDAHVCGTEDTNSRCVRVCVCLWEGGRWAQMWSSTDVSSSSPSSAASPPPSSSVSCQCFVSWSWIGNSPLRSKPRVVQQHPFSTVTGVIVQAVQVHTTTVRVAPVLSCSACFGGLWYTLTVWTC